MRLQRACPSPRSGPRRPDRALRSVSSAIVAGALVLVGFGWAGAGADPSPPVLSWARATPANSPPPLAYSAAAYDADNSTVVLFGGIASNGALSTATWIWNGSTWAEAHPAHSPPGRELASMAFDPSLHQLILFGGQGKDGTLLGDTWAWNGVSWIQVAASGPSPGPREAAPMAYEHSGSLVLFGGTGPAPDTTTSSSTSIPGLGPPSGSDTVLGDTWLWTAAGWVPSTAPGPPARSGAAMAYDQTNGTTVLFGGEATPTSAAAAKPLSDTWVWKGSGWGEAKPAAAPAGRFAGVADGFAPLGGALLVAGEGASGAAADAWVWNGATWSQAAIRGSSDPRIGAAAAYDPATQSMVVFGGEGGGGSVLGDTNLVSVAPPAIVTTTAARQTTTTTGSTPSTSTPRSAPTTSPHSSTSRGTVALGSNTTVAPGAGGGAQAAGPQLQTDQQKVQRGDTVEVSGTGFAPGSVVTLTFHSTPASLGSAVVALNGTFSKIVTIPDGAAPGQHHFLATGKAPSGATAQLSTAVMVLVPHHKGIPTVTTLALLGLALLIPVAAYLGMAGAGAWRRRQQKTA